MASYRDFVFFLVQGQLILLHRYTDRKQGVERVIAGNGCVRTKAEAHVNQPFLLIGTTSAATSSDLKEIVYVLDNHPEAVHSATGSARFGLPNQALAGERCLVHQTIPNPPQPSAKGCIAV